MSAIAIAGLTDAQREVLKGVVVGDLLFLEKDSEASDEDEDEGDDSDDAQSDDDDDDDDEDPDENDSAEESELESDAADYDDESETDRQEAVNPADASINGDDYEEEIAEHNYAVSVASTAHSNTSAGYSNNMAVGYAVLASESTSPASTSAIDGGASNEHAQDTEMSAATSEAGSDDVTDVQQPAARCTLYLVVGVSKTEAGTIDDLVLIELVYHSYPTSDDPDTELEDLDAHTYHIYGDLIVHSVKKYCTHAKLGCAERRSMAMMAENELLKSAHITRNPTGDHVRIRSFDQCPGCTGGFLDSLDELGQLVVSDRYASPTQLEHRPVCPVCIGLPLLKEQQNLRYELELTGTVELGDIVEFHGRLNQRRRLVGHPFYQLDEREWGYRFDDMEDEDDDADQNAGAFEHWAEAMDPNANVKLRPASAATIAALPRKLYGDTQEVRGANEEATACVICTSSFQVDQVVVELPCGHIYCDGSCIAMWLAQFNNCPTCRKEVPTRRSLNTDAGHGQGGTVDAAENASDGAQISQQDAVGQKDYRAGGGFTADMECANVASMATVDADVGVPDAAVAEG